MVENDSEIGEKKVSAEKRLRCRGKVTPRKHYWLLISKFGTPLAQEPVKVDGLLVKLVANSRGCRELLFFLSCRHKSARREFNWLLLAIISRCLIAKLE